MADRRLFAAQAMLEHERYADAERVARDVLATDPEDAEAHRMLAMAYTGQEKYDAALAAVRAAVGYAPDSAFNLYSLAYVFTRRGELTNAERAARDALSRDPDDAPTLRLLAHINLAQGRPHLSLETADDALRLEPWRVNSYVARADALLALRRPKEALAMLRDALEIEPNDAGAWASLGSVEATLDHHREATAAFREALRLDPAMAFARRGLVLALKLRNPVYRALRGRYRFGVLTAGALAIGGFAQSPHTYPFAIALLLVGLPVFIFADHAATARIRLDPQGRHALEPLEIHNSNRFLGALAPVLAAALAWLITRSDAAAFAAFSLGFVFLFVVIAIDRKPGGVRSFILGNALLWAILTIAGALALASTGSRNWSDEFDRLEKTGGLIGWIGNAALIALLLQLFVFGMYIVGYSYFDTLKSTAVRSYNRAIDLRRSWPRLFRKPPR